MTRRLCGQTCPCVPQSLCGVDSEMQLWGVGVLVGDE